MALRRPPTRIELSVDDIAEYNDLKKEQLEASSRPPVQGKDEAKVPVVGKVSKTGAERKAEVADRIGIASRYR